METSKKTNKEKLLASNNGKIQQGDTLARLKREYDRSTNEQVDQY